MTKQEIQDFFSKDYGVKRPAPIKKFSAKVYLICLILFVVPLILLIAFRFYQKSQWNKFHQEVAYRREHLAKKYDQHIQDFINKTNIKELGMEQCGLRPESLIGSYEPFMIRGQNYKAGFWRKDASGTLRTSIQTFNYIFCAEKALYSYTLQYDFLNDKKTETEESFFYKHVTNIKITEETTNLEDDDATISIVENKICIVTSGDKFFVSVLAADDALNKNIKAIRSVCAEQG